MDISNETNRTDTITAEQLDHAFQESILWLQRSRHQHCKRSKQHGEHGHRHTPHFSQQRLLSMLDSDRSTGQSELLDQMQIRPGSLSELLKKMETRGWIERNPSETDRRTMEIRLTENGLKQLDEDEKHQRETLESRFHALSGEEQKELYQLLSKLNTHWREQFGHRQNRCGADHPAEHPANHRCHGHHPHDPAHGSHCHGKHSTGQHCRHGEHRSDSADHDHALDDSSES